MSGEFVEITGVGVCSVAGFGYESLSAGIREGIELFDALETPLPIRYAARVSEPVPRLAGFPDDRKAWLAAVALEEAMEDAGLTESDWTDPSRVGVFLGTGLSSVTAEELAEDVYPHLGTDGCFDRTAMALDVARDRSAPRRHMPERVTEWVRNRLGVSGPCNTSFSACAASAQAIADGLRAIRRGQIDIAIVGGHDSMIHPMGLLSFVVLGALSEDRCRPFDRNRSGFMIGEGAGILILERSEYARRRGAVSRARLLGAGTSADGWNATAPHPDGSGAANAMRRAMKDACIEGERVDYVCAHGTGTPLGDRAEARAIGTTLGSEARVSSVKGSIGHCIAAAGVIEAAVTVASIEHGFVPGTVGLREHDPACDVSVVAETEDWRPKVVLSNSFGFGGQNCSLVFGAANV